MMGTMGSIVSHECISLPKRHILSRSETKEDQLFHASRIYHAQLHASMSSTFVLYCAYE